METKFYNINNLSNTKLFYMLDSITDDSVKLFRRTPAGDEEFNEYELRRMPDGRLLIGFYSYWRNRTIHSLVAKCGSQEEFVNVQPFERIVPYWNTGISFDDKGVFCFLDSQPIHDPRDEWRCDTTSYGPIKYLGKNEQPRLVLYELSQIKIYEPIISIGGIGNIVYLHLNDDENIRDNIVNTEEIPAFTVTLSEMFRLLTEWATLAEAPFNSTDPIVLDAKEFLNQVGFDGSLVADQTNMQVAQYFLGNTDARRRPADVVDNNQGLLRFVKSKMAHMSLANLLSCYPEYEISDAEIQFDIDSADQEFVHNLGIAKIEGDFSLDNYKDALDLIPDNRANEKQFYKFKWNILKQKKDLALALANK
jgi:hypothetical protein